LDDELHAATMTELQNNTSGKFQKAFNKCGVFEKICSC
jgi:hypothetical protein